MRTDALVQPKAATPRDANTPEATAIAERGVADATNDYPHRETIQQSFGKHDLHSLFSSRTADASRANQQLGARAYAYGDRVAFGESPDLHTAAHEAAHFVQQRAGVARASDGPGDRFEQHADDVADAVVAGRSAEPILDQLAGAGRDAAPATPVVQRRPKEIEDYYRDPQTAYTYVGVHHRKILDAVHAKLASFDLPDPHPRLAWAAASKSVADVFELALESAIGELESLNLKIRELLYPVDPWVIVDRHRHLSDLRPGETRDGREPTGTIDWNPVIGEALAIEFVGRLRDSAPRMGLRYVALADDFNGDLTPEQLVATMPIDRVVARMLCTKGVVKLVPDKHKGGKKPRDTDAPTAFKAGLQLVTFEWVDDDPALWNWIKFEPANATREEVSAALFERGDGQNHTEYAYALELSGNMCQVPVEWARKFDAPAKREPRDNGAPDGSLALADSRLGDDVAVVEGARHRDATKKEPRPDIAKLAPVLEQSQRQLELLRDAIVPWGVAYMIGPAWRWITKHRDNLRAAPEETLRKWTPIIEGQHAILFDATADILELASAAKGRDPKSSEAKPFAEVVRAYAIAIGESHLVDTARTQLTSAQRKKAALPIVLLEMSVHEHRDATEDYIAQGPKPKPWERGTDPVEVARNEERTLSQQTLALRERMLSGGTVEPDEIEAVAVTTSELSFRKRVKSLSMRLWELQQLALGTTDKSGSAKFAAIFHTSIGGLQKELIDIFNEVFALEGRFDDQISRGLAAPDVPKEPKAFQKFSVAVRRQAVSDGTSALKQIDESRDLKNLFTRAAQVIEDHELYTRIVEIVVLLSFSAVGGVAGAIVGGAVRGAILAEAAVDTAAFTRSAMAARLIGGAAGLGTDAAINAAGSAWMFGEDMKLSFAENLISGAILINALKPLRKAAEAWGKVDQNVVGLWGKVGQYGKWGLVKSGMLTAELIGGAASGYVAARIVHGERPANEQVAEQWAMQGAMMAISHVVHGASNKLAERMGILGSEAAMHLRKRAEAHAKLAASLGESSSAEEALHVIDEHARLLDAEAKLLQDPVIAAKLDPRQLAVLRQGHDFAEGELKTHGLAIAKLHFAGLSPMAADASVWSGSKAQIETAIAEAGPAASNVARDETTHRWRAMIGGRAVQFLELETPVPTSAATMTKPLGERIAAKVPGARYESGGTFRIRVHDREVAVTIRRTSGKPRILTEEDELVLEVPHGLEEPELEKLIVEKLAEAHDVAARHFAAPTHAAHRDPRSAAREPSAEQLTEEMGIGAVEVTATAVPGSSFKGKGEAPLETTALLAAGKQALDEIAVAQEGVTGEIEHAHVDDKMREWDKAIAANTRVIHLADGSAITIRVSIAPLEGQTVARSVMNPTKQGITAVDRGAHTKVDVDVHGRYVIQLSNKLDATHVRRAVAHEVTEILARRELGNKPVPADALRPGADPKAPLSPHDRGRIAEIEELARSLDSGDPRVVEDARHELIALVEDLGLRKGIAGADERVAKVKAKLGKRAAEELEKMRTGEAELSEAERKRLTWLRDDAAKDRKEQAAFEEAHKPLHERPTTGLSRKATKSEREGLAARAKAKREAASRRWVESIRGANARGEHPKMRIQIGGNAALAARDPQALLVDANERWGVDASEHLAQTAQQMEPIKAAGIGDPYEFADANERVPMEAVRYWQDEIAAQGPIIDGKAELGLGDNGKLIATIRPSDGSAPVVVEVDGVPVIATGFTKENAPGAPRAGLSPRQALNQVDLALRALENDPNLGVAAKAARTSIAKLHGQDQTDATKALEALPADLRAKLPKVLESLPPDVQKTLAAAIETLEAQASWTVLKEKHPGHVFAGDEANRLTDDQLKGIHRAVIAGAGGTGISAAEIILNKNPKAHVVMVGLDAPAGLAENDQFRSVVAKHGSLELCKLLHIEPKGADGRFEFYDGYRLGAPKEVADGKFDVNAAADPGRHSSTPPSHETFQGDTYVSALGRFRDLPPPMAALADSVERSGGSVLKVARFDDDGLYVGYGIELRDANDRVLSTIDVTGAASRFADEKVMSNRHAIDARAAEDFDAPPESGNFAGGYSASAVQAARYRSWRRKGDQ